MYQTSYNSASDTKVIYFIAEVREGNVSYVKNMSRTWQFVNSTSCRHWMVTEWQKTHRGTAK